MATEKKQNAFTRFTEKHAEIWKFIKFSIAGGGSSAIELVVHMLLLNFVFASLTAQAIRSEEHT